MVDGLDVFGFVEFREHRLKFGFGLIIDFDPFVWIHREFGAVIIIDA